ncbi:MAG: hypothetical protein EA408_03355 [Marinilabiliales bacterium]|nr:MAG: hypothetical protein EA408_03355 [Marinilabiliales bacterium]
MKTRNYFTNRKTVLPGIIAVLLILSGFSGPLKAGPDRYFPAIDGWERQSDIDVYTPETLWDIINGAADLFYAYDFIELFWAEYISTEDESVYIVMEIYRQGGPVRAFGVYSQERPMSPELVDIGVQGYRAPGVLHFFVGDCYVKIRSHDRSADTEQAMNKLARHVSDMIDPDPQFPAIVTSLPEEHKVAFSEEFINTNFLGHQFLSRAFVSTYEREGERYNLFLIENETKEESRQLLASYYEFSGQDADLQEGVHRVADRWNGEVGIVWKGNRLYGYYNLENSELQEKYLALFSGN